MLDVRKQLKHLMKFWQLTRNSDSWFACDSELFFNVMIYLKFQEGCCPLEPQIIENLSAFLESLQVRDRFSRCMSHSEEKCSAMGMEKNLAFLIQFMYSTFDREIRAYGCKARPWCGRSFGYISLDDKGEIWKTACRKISHPVQVRVDPMLNPWCNGIKSLR